VAVLEGANVKWWQNIRQVGAWWGQWSRLGEGWAYWRSLQRASVPLRFGWSVIGARGAETVEEVVIARLNADWQPVPGSEQTFSVDTLVIGYGFIPSTQLSRLLGCTHIFRPELGGYVPCRDDKLQTSCSGVYAVGDGAGIGGVELARLEGRMAGVAVAERLNRLDKNAAQAVIAHLQPVLARERRFAMILGQMFTPGPGLYGLATDDTLICRCEEIRLADIREAVQSGAQTANAVKGITRAGMGNCQGRICAEAVARVIAAEGGNPGEYTRRLETAGIFTVRSPLYPLPLRVLAAAANVA
jgi:NAD(P)H-nitrite reductase large subunit